MAELYELQKKSQSYKFKPLYQKTEKIKTYLDYATIVTIYVPEASLEYYPCISIVFSNKSGKCRIPCENFDVFIDFLKKIAFLPWQEKDIKKIKDAHAKSVHDYNVLRDAKVKFMPLPNNDLK